MTAIQMTSSVSTEEDADLLEKILKDAEEFALKMTQQNNHGEESVSTRGGDETSESPSSPPKYAKIESSLSSDNDTELEELLKQSETLLGKMRSKKHNEDVGSANSPPTTKVEPPQTSPNAPTSVYVAADLGPDELSSVGSNSLASPQNTQASSSLRLPSYSSSTTPIQEEPFTPTMQQHAVPKHVPLPATEMATTATAIPDFTVTSPNAKWEKVELANQGDDDYVPLVDYSKLKKDQGNKNKASSLKMKHDFDDGATAATAKQSRVAAFRAHKRRLRKKRLRQMAVLIFCALAFGGYFMFVRKPGAKKVVDIVREEESLEEIVLDSEAWDDLMEHAESATYTEFLDSSTNHMDNLLEVAVESDDTCSDETEEGTVKTEGEASEKEPVLLEKDEVDVVEPEIVARIDHGKWLTETDKEEETTQGFDEGVQSDLRLKKRCKNPFRRVFSKKCRILAWGEKCQSPLKRLLNRDCRKLVRHRKGKKKIMGIHLQAVAGI
jgi:hypothetical protein